jgi:hypothetical protein
VGRYRTVWPLLGRLERQSLLRRTLTNLVHAIPFFMQSVPSKSSRTQLTRPVGKQKLRTGFDPELALAGKNLAGDAQPSFSGSCVTAFS